MKIKLLNQEYQVIDTKEKITVADSFVVRQNKIGKGNGEAKLYVGNNNSLIRNFFGNLGFTIPCFLLKEDLLKYLDETEVEYLNPEQPYQQKSSLPLLWAKRKAKVDALPEKVEFEIRELDHIQGPRIYVKSENTGYKLIRELSLPNITYISIIKLLDTRGNITYYFRLFADYFGEIQHPYTLKKEQEDIEKIEQITEKTTLTKARVGQGKYRKELLKSCPICPITLIGDDRILIASHIKPWSKSTATERTDPYNGFMFTPTFDFLFDRGFLSFTEDKKTLLSPFLSKLTYKKLGISPNTLVSHLPIEGREKYLEYHREYIFK